MIQTNTSVNDYLVKVEEDNEAILRVELDKAHLLAEVLDHHPGLPLLGLASQRVGSKLWLSRLEEEMPAHKKMIDRIVESLATFSGAFPDQGGEKADGRLAAPLTSTLLLPEPFNDGYLQTFRKFKPGEESRTLCSPPPERSLSNVFLLRSPRTER